MRVTIRAILIYLASAAALALLALAQVQDAEKAPPKSKLIRAARLTDVKAGKTLKDRGIWIEGDRIREVGPIEDVRKHAPPEAEEIDLGNATILPGLIDCHTHLLQNYNRQMGDDPNMVLTVAQLGTTRRALLGVAMAREALEAGFTTVRDLGNSGVNGDVALRDAIEAGWVVGPRIVASTRALSAAGGQFGGLAAEAQRLVEHEYVAISGVEEARRAVRQALYDGADCIKVIVNTGPRVVSLEEMKVIVEEAHRVKKKVAAHAIGDQATRIAAEAGVDSIEHAYSVPDDALKMMAEKRIFLVPTDGPAENYASPPVRPETSEAIKRFIEANHDRLKRAIKLGVPIAAGSDSYYQLPGKTRGQASLGMLRAYADAGMTPTQVLRAATADAAELLGLAERTGSIEAGKIADLIAVPGDPLDDVAALGHVTFVMKGGAVVRRDPPSDEVDDYINSQMQKRRIPGLSLAIIQDSKIVKAKGYGVLEKVGEEPVTPSTLFQAGSISKSVAAAGALRLVEQGKLALDEDVNAKLRTWKVPDNDFTKENKVTLRGLLSHSAGLTVHGFPGYDRDVTFPTLVQILDGEKPANTAPIRVDASPGTRWRYSGGGYTVMQQMMIDVVGKAFPEFMQEAVLGPVGMRSSSYEQPLPDDRAKFTAAGVYHDGTAVKRRWHVYPEMAAAGLWTTPSDLARFAMAIQDSFAGKSDSILSREMTRQMLTVQKQDDGLGVFLEGKGVNLRFTHGGRDEGFDALLIAYAESGQGAVVMINANENSGMVSRIMKVIAKEYHWPDYPTFATRERRPPVNVEASTLADYTGHYDLDHNVLSVIEMKGKLIGKLNDVFLDEFLPETETTFTMPDVEREATFEQDAKGEVTGLRWKTERGEQKMSRIGPLIHALEPRTDPDAALTREVETALKAFSKGGEAVKEVPRVTPGARRDLAHGLPALDGIQSLDFIAAQDVAERTIERHGSRVARVLHYKLLTDKAPRYVLVYLTADGLVTDLDVVED